MKNIFLAAAVATLSFGTSAGAAPVQWTVADGGNDHWYEIVWPRLGVITWNTAKELASSMSHMGQTGYLATVGSQAEQDFLNELNMTFTASSSSHSGTYVRAWLGGTDQEQEGDWKWANGESLTYTNWQNNQPNNWINPYTGEDQDYMVGWWRGDQWNDCQSRTCNIHKFVVEYDAPPSQVPVPASLPLAAAGFGIMGWVARRRKSA